MAKARFLLIAFVIWLGGASLHAVNAQDDAEWGESLAGRLIVAAPEMPENSFSRTVILMISHDPDGAFGLVLNRSVAEGPIVEVLERLGVTGGFPPSVRDAEAPIRIVSGGPVEQAAAFLLHGGPLGETDTPVAPGLAIARDLTALERLVGLPETPPLLLALGYSGWGPGQLEGEFARGDWRHMFPDRALLLETPSGEMWRAAIGKLPTEL